MEPSLQSSVAFMIIAIHCSLCNKTTPKLRCFIFVGSPKSRLIITNPNYKIRSGPSGLALVNFAIPSSINLQMTRTNCQKLFLFSLIIFSLHVRVFRKSTFSPLLVFCYHMSDAQYNSQYYFSFTTIDLLNPNRPSF